MALSKKHEQAIRDHVDLDDATRSLICQANQDLYLGPHDEDGYPGFEPACRAIRDAMPRGDLYISINGDVSDTEPKWVDEGDGDGEHPEDWCLLSFRRVKEIFVGSELAGYV